MTSAALTLALENSVVFEQSKKHLENMIGALAELMYRDENRDVDTVEEFLAAVKFMNENAGMTYKADWYQHWLEQENNKLTPQ